MMSTQQLLKQMIYEIMNDHKTHTSLELQTEAIRRNILVADNSTAIRNAIFNIRKEDPLFTSPQKGEYLLLSSKPEKDAFTLALETIHLRITELQRFNWITCSDFELENARNDISLLKKMRTALYNLI